MIKLNYIKMYNLIRHSVWTDDWQMTKNNKNIPPGMMQYKVSQEVILSLLPNAFLKILIVFIIKIGPSHNIHQKIYKN